MLKAMRGTPYQSSVSPCHLKTAVTCPCVPGTSLRPPSRRCPPTDLRNLKYCACRTRTASRNSLLYTTLRSVSMFCKVKLHIVGLRALYKIQRIYKNLARHRDGPRIESRWKRDFSPRPDWPWSPPSLLYKGYRIFPGGKAAGAWC